MLKSNPSQINRLIAGRNSMTMSLDEFKAHVFATRKASTMQAMSALSATISTPTNDKDNK